MIVEPGGATHLREARGIPQAPAGKACARSWSGWPASGPLAARRHIGTEIEYLVSPLGIVQAICAFAGDDPDRAVSSPRRARPGRFDDRVTHYEVLAAAEVQMAGERR